MFDSKLLEYFLIFISFQSRDTLFCHKFLPVFPLCASDVEPSYARENEKAPIVLFQTNLAAAGDKHRPITLQLSYLIEGRSEFFQPPLITSAPLRTFRDFTTGTFFKISFPSRSSRESVFFGAAAFTWTRKFSSNFRSDSGNY